MAAKKAFALAEFPEAPGLIRLLDGKERRVRLTLATLRKFDKMPLVEPESKDLNYEQIAQFVWAVLLDKDDLAGPDDILELVTAPLLGHIMLTLQDLAAGDGEALKNDLGRATARAAGGSTGPASSLSDVLSSGSGRMNSGPTPLTNSPS